MARRSYGSGSLFTRTDAAGVESWYGRWYVGGSQIQRKIGPKRKTGTREGLTATKAEREMQRRIERERAVIRSGITIAELGDRYLDHLEHVMERKPTTIGDYRSMLNRHLEPYFGERAIERIDPERIGALITAKKREGLATKTITNMLTFLHGLFAFAVKRGWVIANPVAAVDRPRAPDGDPDIRYLDLEDLEALIRAVPEDYLGQTERALYLAAAMSGLRQGELIALRWIDVDWTAARIRVRRNFTRQAFGTPKSKRSSRSVPMAARLAGALDRHFQASEYQGEEDLVSSLPTPTPALRSTPPRCASATRRRSPRPNSARCASTTCATPSALTAPRQASRSAPCRSGWATAT